MTGSFPTRRPRRTIGHRGVAGSERGGHSAVGEQLRDARASKGLDLFRVERDTKIRAKYLAALEDGEFADLPGDVYTRGFIRNYATYLGLDADEVEEDWRREVGRTEPVRETAFVGPRPLTIRRGMVFQRSHLAIVGVVAIVALVGIYFGYQVTRFLSYPTLGVSSPNAASITVPIGTTAWKLTGAATPGATISIVWDTQEPTTTIADESGHWSYAAAVHPGKNQFDIVAKNLDTNHASKTQTIMILVPIVTPAPPSPVVAFSSPEDGALVKDGNLTVAGTSTLITTVILTPVYLGPPPAAGATSPPPSSSPLQTPILPASSASPGLSVGPTVAPGPGPSSTNTNADGTFSFALGLTAGRWQLTIAGSNPSGSLAPPVTRTIVVPYKGINVVIQIKGGTSSMAYFHDGVTDDDSGSVQTDGWTRTIVATRNVCINVNTPSHVYLIVNGISYGPVSTFGGRHAYVDTSGVPKNVEKC